MNIKKLKEWLDDWADFMSTDEKEFKEALSSELSLYISNSNELQNIKDMLKVSRNNFHDAMLRIQELEQKLCTVESASYMLLRHVRYLSENPNESRDNMIKYANKALRDYERELNK